MSTRILPAFLWPLLACLLPAGASSAQVPPLRVLVLSGGGFHEFERNLDLLLAGVKALIPVEVDRVQLQRTPVPPGRKQPPRILAAHDLGSRYDVILQYTQGDEPLVTQEERDGLLQFVRSGGGWVGLHCASDTFKDWDEYIRMVGGRFSGHPPLADVRVLRIAGDHPVLDGLTDFTLRDELYSLDRVDLSAQSVCLVGIAPDTQTRPLAWTKTYGQGRVFYTALGHSPEAHGDANYQRLVANALRWARRQGG